MASKLENIKRSQHLWWSRKLGWLFQVLATLALGELIGRLWPDASKWQNNQLVVGIAVLLFIGWLLHREELEPEPEDDQG